MLQMAKQMEMFKVNLEEFAAKHKDDIRKDPEFRVSFQEMCASIGVDPLACKSVCLLQVMFPQGSPPWLVRLSVHLPVSLSVCYKLYVSIGVNPWLVSLSVCPSICLFFKGYMLSKRLIPWLVSHSSVNLSIHPSIIRLSDCLFPSIHLSVVTACAKVGTRPSDHNRLASNQLVAGSNPDFGNLCCELCCLARYFIHIVSNLTWLKNGLLQGVYQ